MLPGLMGTDGDLFGDGWGACRLWCLDCGWSWRGWRSGGRLQIFYFGGGYFHGSQAVVGKVVDGDAEKVFALGGSADLLSVLDTMRDVFLQLVEGGGDMEFGDEPIDENACGIEDEDGELEGGVDFAVGVATKRDVGGLDGIVDVVATEGAVHFFRQDVARGGIVFGLGRRADGEDGNLHDDLAGCG
jgi:hypothetical protein